LKALRSKAAGAAPLSLSAARPSLLQRKCACGGGAARFAGECGGCSKKRLVGAQAAAAHTPEPARRREGTPDRLTALASTSTARPSSSSAAGFGHDFGRLRLSSHAGGGPAEGPGRRNKNLGHAVCVPERGAVVSKVHKEHCAGDCVAQHEQVHVNDMEMCCGRYGRCMVEKSSNVDERNRCREAWMDYDNKTTPWSECNAYTAEENCLTEIIEKHCRVSVAEPKVSLECCNDLEEKQLKFVRSQKQNYCPGTPRPCPFTESGEIIKI